MELFEAKVKYDKICEDGVIKKIPEQYVVEALSFTEAEARVTKDIAQFSSGEFEVSDLKRSRVTEVIENEDAAADTWYKATVAFVTIDEKTDKEKRTLSYFLIQGKDLNDARETLLKWLGKGMADYVVVSIAETKILDILRYVAPTESEKKD